MKLWTVIGGYGATGEGATTQIFITHAKNREDAIEKFERRSNWLRADCAEEGLGSLLLKDFLSTACLARLAAFEGKGTVEFFVEHHINFS